MKTEVCSSAAEPPCRRKPRFCLRRRMKRDRMIQGRLRIRSMPGAFLVLGLLVVAVGTALAVAGYWPYRFSGSTAADDAEQADPRPSGWSLFSPAGLLHGDRMKLLGPVVMGVGLFILICANTVLYENRDRETQMLLAQMRNVICSVSAAVPSAGLRDLAAANSVTRHCQWVSSLPAAHLNILCVRPLARSEPLLQTGREQQEARAGEAEPPPASPPPCWDAQTAEDGPLLRVNFCLLSASSLSNIHLDEADADAPAAAHRRCHSMSCRTKPQVGPRRHAELHRADLLHASRTAAGSQDWVSVPLEKAAAEEEQAGGSWPRLDLGGGRRYLKLENKEDSVDRLLEQLEQQGSSRDQSFGSGPFQ